MKVYQRLAADFVAEGVTHISGPVVVTPEGATPITRPEHKAPVSSKQAAAAPLLENAGDAADISPRLLEAIAYVESRFNTKAVSPKGAVGMMQLAKGVAVAWQDAGGAWTIGSLPDGT